MLEVESHLTLYKINTFTLTLDLLLRSYHSPVGRVDDLSLYHRA